VPSVADPVCEFPGMLPYVDILASCMRPLGLDAQKIHFLQRRPCARSLSPFCTRRYSLSKVSRTLTLNALSAGSKYQIWLGSRSSSYPTPPVPLHPPTSE
jgi:hypothetical protein